ncbi:MAG: hypothetical protein IKE22_07070 [Atopobiaceae bacterium]|nr:hypothetical protein [Atopobiaceae bacterium]
MPNYVRNELTIPDPQEADRAFSLMRSDEREFDFNRICPVPPEIYCGDVGSAESIIFAQERARSFDPFFGAALRETDTALNWCRHYWGTKWNAFNVKRVDATKVRFETAWSGVPRIVMLLALHERLTEFEYVWASEDFGYECGRLVGSPATLVHGQPFYADLNLPKGGSREAFEISSSVWPEFASHGPKDSGWRRDELSKEITYFDCDDESEEAE